VQARKLLASGISGTSLNSTFIKAAPCTAAVDGFAGWRVGDGDGFSVNCVDGIGPLLEHQNLLDLGGASATAGKKARMED